MFDYLEKYKKLPKEVRDKLSAPAVMAAVSNLEKKYGVNLAAVVMKIAVKSININNLTGYFIEELKLSEKNGKQLEGELLETVFPGIADYLKIKPTLQSGQDISPQKQKIPEPVLSGKEQNILPPQKEIKEAQEVHDYAEKISYNDQIEEKIKNTISKVNIVFSSELLENRFRNILKTYLRGVRDKLEAKQTLMKPIDSGGLGIDEISARKILLIADGNAKNLEKDIVIKPPKKITVPEDEMEAKPKLNEIRKIEARDMEYDLSALKKKEGMPEMLDTEHELAPPAPSVVRKIEEKEDRRPAEKPESFLSRIARKKEVSEEKKQEAPKPKPEVKAPEMFSRMAGPAQTGGKIKMEDVKFQPKVMGPVDELRYMSLIDFRRLDQDPMMAAKKIKEKVGILEEEYKGRTEGVTAWRESPVNKLYLKMGGASINYKKPINAIIEERKSSGKEYLNEKEFEAIIRLNKELRF